MDAAAPHRPPRRRLRDRQRAAHLLAGVVLLVHVYLGPLLGAGFGAAVQWAVVPAAVASGIALWKGPQLRRMLRGASRR